MNQCLIANVLCSTDFGLASDSFHMLLVASTERYISLFCPYSHKRIVNGFKPKAVAIVVWINALVDARLNKFYITKNWLYFTMIVVIFLELVRLSFVHAKIFHVAYKVRKQIRHQLKAYKAIKS